jgi:hypothetical protein
MKKIRQIMDKEEEDLSLEELQERKTFMQEQLRHTHVLIQERQQEEEKRENDFDDEFADFDPAQTEEDAELG